MISMCRPEHKRVEKLRYMHRNQVKRGLVRRRNSGGGAGFGITRMERWGWFG